MHWINYRTLVDYLTTMDPKKFDYIYQDDPDHGCVSCHVRYVLDRSLLQGGAIDAIRVYLNVSSSEAAYVFGAAGDSPAVGDIEPSALKWDHDDIRLGDKGIREALRRLAVVAERHGGEPQPQVSQPLRDPVAPTAEQQFLDSVRAIAERPSEFVGAE